MATGVEDSRQQLLVDRLLYAIAGSVQAASYPQGSQNLRNVVAEQVRKKARLEQGGPDEREKRSAYASRVADARFALGANDGAYLRTNVMPLQTAFLECDEQPLAITHPDLHRAGHLGVLNAVSDRIKKRREECEEKMRLGLETCAWLLTIPEVATFVDEYLKAQAPAPTAEAIELIRSFVGQDGLDLQPAANKMLDATNRAAACELLVAVLVIFGQPMETAIAQYETTVGPWSGNAKSGERSGMQKLMNGLRRLADEAREPLSGLAGTDASESTSTSLASLEPNINDADLLQILQSNMQVGAPEPVLSRDSAQQVLEQARKAFGRVANEAKADEIPRLQKVLETLRSNVATLNKHGMEEAGVHKTIKILKESIEEATLRAARFEAAKEYAIMLIEMKKSWTANEKELVVANKLKAKFEEADEKWERQKRYLAGLKSEADAEEKRQLDAKAQEQSKKKRTAEFVKNLAKNLHNAKDERIAYKRSLLDAKDDKLAEEGLQAALSQMSMETSEGDRYSGISPFFTPSTKNANEPDSYAVAYCLSRGLCARSAPHHNHDGKLPYSVPRSVLGDEAALPPEPVNKLEFGKGVFGRAMIDSRLDFADELVEPGKLFVEETEQLAKWAPVTVSSSGKIGLASKASKAFKGHDAVAKSVICEVLVNFYKSRTTPRNSDRLLGLACAAAAKIMQLEHMNTVLNHDDLLTLCDPNPMDEKSESVFFLTRPVVRCPGPKAPVLYPCDAGLAYYSTSFAADDAPGSPVGAPGASVGTDAGEDSPTPRNVLTAHMRKAIAEDEADGDDVPIYIAASPTLNTLPNTTPTPPNVTDAEAARSVFPKDASNSNHERLHSVLLGAYAQCQQLRHIECEEKAIEDATNNLRSQKVPTADEAARMRRQLVWNDAQREACISGDRLWAFVRLLSGTISENVDAVCMIDEGMLVRQQQQDQERGMRLSERAAQEHMQLVRSVFSAVIRESGLTLGIDQTGEINELKVVSNALRKQATELAAGQGGGGLFANSVRLENLLSKGTGEMTLAQLFDELQNAGRALQVAAEPTSVNIPTSASLDFLSAPRNSLLLRYKPEALAAMRHAFDVFQQEIASHHWHSMRRISAYELIEGADETLTSAFAQFTAHTLVNSRMYSSATAMYIGAWPAAANATQLKISLQRLVRAACSYVTKSEKPMFFADEGRALYFASFDRKFL
jgi:hypothetical protein